MKTISHLLTLTFLVGVLSANAQQLEHRAILAHDPFTSDLNDATGNHGPAEVINAPIQGAEGIYSNGNCAGNKVYSVAETQQTPANDKRIGNTHLGVGRTFKGNFRNLKVYGKVAVGIERSEQIVFELLHQPENGLVKVQSSESLHDIQYKIYSIDGKTIGTQNLPNSGLIRTNGLPAGAHVLTLYRENKVIGMKKLITI